MMHGVGKSDVFCSTQADEGSQLTAVWEDIFLCLPRHGRYSIDEFHRAVVNQGNTLSVALVSVPAMIPTPGLPVGFVFGVILFFLAYELFAGGQSMRLPGPIARLTLPAATMHGLTMRITPWLKVVDRYTAPRLTILTSAGRSRALSAIIMLMAILISLPIPFGNFVPALATFLIAVGQVRRDGALVMCGMALSVIALVALSAVIFWGVQAVSLFAL